MTSVISIGGYVFYNLTYAEAVEAYAAAVAAAPAGYTPPPVTSVSVDAPSATADGQLQRAERHREPSVRLLGALVQRQERAVVGCRLQRDETVVGRPAEHTGAGEASDQTSAILELERRVGKPLRKRRGRDRRRARRARTAAA